MGIREKETELFAAWKQKYVAMFPNSTFVVDGAPCPASYESSPVKCLIVLKDVNLDSKDPYTEEFPLRDQLADKPHPWWRTVANWCAGLSGIHEEKNLTWDELQNSDIRDSLKPFAFMQLKKVTGGSSIGANVLAEHAVGDKVEILKQIQIYQPEVIICCGVGNLVRALLGGSDWLETQRGVKYVTVDMDGNRTVVIDYMHPSARAARNIVCYGILDAYREIVMSNTAS